MVLRISMFAGSLHNLMLTVLYHMWWERLTHGHTSDVVITCDVSCIIQGIPSFVDLCLYDTKGNHSGDHTGIYMTLDCIKPQHIKKGSLSGGTVLFLCLSPRRTSKYQRLMEAFQALKWKTCASAEENYNLQAECSMAYRRTGRIKTRTVKSWMDGVKNTDAHPSSAYTDPCHHIGNLLSISKKTFFQ